jgi:hypothetical protein
VEGGSNWQEYVCPLGYTPLAQIVISFVLGLIFCYFSLLLVSVIFFCIIYEAAYFYIVSIYDYNRWNLLARMGIVFGYVAGWLVGRLLLGMEIGFFGEEKDHKCGLVARCWCSDGAVYSSNPRYGSGEKMSETSKKRMARSGRGCGCEWCHGGGETTSESREGSISDMYPVLSDYVDIPDI